MKGIKWLIRLWIFSLGFIYLLDLPYVEMKIQLAELIFLLLFFTTLILKKGIIVSHLKSNEFKSTALIWIKICLMFLFSVGISSLANFSRSSSLELMGLIYLFISSIWVIFLMKLDSSIREVFFTSFLYLGQILSASSIFIFILHQLEVPGLDPLLDPKFIPWLGEIPRVKGWMPSSALLASLLSIPFLLLLVRLRKDKNWWSLILVSIGLLLTFSKSLLLILPLGMGLFTAHYFGKKGRSLIHALSLGCAILLLLFTHFVPLSTYNQGEDVSYLSEEVLYTTEKVEWRLSTYWYLKKSAAILFIQNPILGVGPGQFSENLKHLQKGGFYPSYMPIYDPHSSLFGVMAEAGALGFIGFIVLIGGVIRMLLQINQTGEGEKNSWINMLPYFFIVLLIESLFTDILNYRHLWVLLGLLVFEYKHTIDGNIQKRDIPEMGG